MFHKGQWVRCNQTLGITFVKGRLYEVSAVAFNVLEFYRNAQGNRDCAADMYFTPTDFTPGEANPTSVEDIAQLVDEANAVLAKLRNYPEKWNVFFEGGNYQVRLTQEVPEPFVVNGDADSEGWEVKAEGAFVYIGCMKFNAVALYHGLHALLHEEKSSVLIGTRLREYLYATKKGVCTVPNRRTGHFLTWSDAEQVFEFVKKVLGK